MGWNDSVQILFDTKTYAKYSLTWDKLLVERSPEVIRSHAERSLNYEEKRQITTGPDILYAGPRYYSPQATFWSVLRFTQTPDSKSEAHT